MRLLVALLGVFTAFAQDSGFTISGIVVDHVTNHPLNHVLVEIASVGKAGGDASVLTDSDGRFTFLNVPKGKYNLQAQKRGQFPQSFHASDGGYATAIVVDGHLKTENLIFPLLSGSSIGGKVIGDDGEPVGGAQVQLFRDNVVDGEAQTIQVNSATTNSSGQFHFGHLDAGRYYLAASGMPWFNDGSAAQSVYPITFYGDTTDAVAAKSIALAEGAVEEVQVALHLVPAIRVKVANSRQSFSLSVPGPGGFPIPVSSSMMASTLGGQVGFSGPGSAQMQYMATQQGAEPSSMELSNIPAGRYQVNTNDQNGQPGQAAQTVDLTDGSTLSVATSGNSVLISGRIIFDTPRPDDELLIFLSGHRSGMVAPVANDGRFKFEPTSAGTFDVNLNSPSLIATSLEAKGARVAHDRLDVASGASVELTIHAQASESMARVDGFAMQGETGMAGAMVLLLPQDPARVRLIRRDQSDADGSFSLTNVQPGRYTVVAIDDGQELAYKDVKTMKPYLEGGVAVTIPLKSNDPVKVPVQSRKQ